MPDGSDKDWYNAHYSLHPTHSPKKRVDTAYDPRGGSRYRKMYCRKCYTHNYQVIVQEDLARNSGIAQKTNAIIEAERMSCLLNYMYKIILTF